jgi:hypothetical protein
MKRYLISAGISVALAVAPHIHHRHHRHHWLSHHHFHHHYDIATTEPAEPPIDDKGDTPDMPFRRRVSRPAELRANVAAWTKWLACTDAHRESPYAPLSQNHSCHRELTAWNEHAPQLQPSDITTPPPPSPTVPQPKPPPPKRPKGAPIITEQQPTGTTQTASSSQKPHNSHRSKLASSRPDGRDSGYGYSTPCQADSCFWSALVGTKESSQVTSHPKNGRRILRTAHTHSTISENTSDFSFNDATWSHW